MTITKPLAVAALAATILLAPSAPAAEPIKALMIAGGCCHDYTNQKRIIAEGIGARANVEWTIIHEGSDREIKIDLYNDKNWSDGYDVVVHNECYGSVKDDAFINNIAAPHKEGLPAVMLHCSTHSYRAGSTDEWRKCLGMSSYSHEKNRDLNIENLQPDHPVMIGFPMTWLDKRDELYKNAKVWPNVIPLAKAYGQDTKMDHVVIWLNTYGKGRVFATTLGHNNSTMEDPVYLDLVTRGLLWAVDKLDDKGKPKPGYGK